MLLAGRIAERVVDPISEKDWCDRFDAEQLLAHALRVPPWSEPVRRLMACCSRLVRVQVGMHWPAIERVAFALLEHGTVTGDDVRRLTKETHDEHHTIARGGPALEIRRVAGGYERDCGGAEGALRRVGSPD